MAAKEEKPATRRNRLSALASDVPGLTRTALGRKGFAEAGLIGAWASIVGPEIARLALPVRLRFSPPPSGEKGTGETGGENRGGILTLKASPAASLEVQHMKPRIIERISAYFGYPAVSVIRIETADRQRMRKPARKDSVPISGSGVPDLSRVEDPDIRAALERLGAARARRG